MAINIAFCTDDEMPDDQKLNVLGAIRSFNRKYSLCFNFYLNESPLYFKVCVTWKSKPIKVHQILTILLTNFYCTIASWITINMQICHVPQRGAHTVCLMLSFVYVRLISRTIENSVYPQGVHLEVCIIFLKSIDILYQCKTQ